MSELGRPTGDPAEPVLPVNESVIDPTPPARSLALDDGDPADLLPDVTADQPRELEPETKHSGAGRWLREWSLVLGIALGAALIIRLFVFQPFYIPSGSMLDTLHVHDRILVNKLSYKLHDIRRGDVIVFDRPSGWEVGDDVKDLVKRVIGLPGDTLTFRDCAVYVNGQPLDEPYTGGQCTNPPNQSVDPDHDGSVKVADDSVFVLGDNRGDSSDSRINGSVPENKVVGRAFVVYWPIGNWKWL
jgi:signal peptidase I